METIDIYNEIRFCEWLKIRPYNNVNRKIVYLNKHYKTKYRSKGTLMMLKRKRNESKKVKI